jgi:hypothetical protein
MMAVSSASKQPLVHLQEIYHAFLQPDTRYFFMKCDQIAVVTQRRYDAQILRGSFAVNSLARRRNGDTCGD